MTTPNMGTKTALEAKLQLIAAGVQQYVPAKSNVLLSGQSVPVAQVLTQLNDGLAGFAEVRSSKSAWQKAVATQEAQAAVLRTLIAQLKAWAEVTFGKGSPLLSAMGFAPQPKAAPTVVTKAVALAKAANTRAARHILGTKQRAAITTGVKPALVITGLETGGGSTPTGAPGPVVATGSGAPAGTTGSSK
jgi:hypothetical protein